MKYFIGYLISGEAAEWHTNTARNISDKFGTWKIHEKLPPHITIFYPFDTDNLEDIRSLVKAETQDKDVPGDFEIDGFGHFDNRVVSAEVKANQSIIEIVDELRKKINKFPAMPKDEFPEWHPHATLANRVSPGEIEKIWGYVQTLEKPNFLLPFDNVTIFKFEGDKKWIAQETFKFNSK